LKKKKKCLLPFESPENLLEEGGLKIQALELDILEITYLPLSFIEGSAS